MLSVNKPLSFHSTGSVFLLPRFLSCRDAILQFLAAVRRPSRCYRTWFFTFSRAHHWPSWSPPIELAPPPHHLPPPVQPNRRKSLEACSHSFSTIILTKPRALISLLAEFALTPCLLSATWNAGNVKKENCCKENYTSYILAHLWWKN